MPMEAIGIRPIERPQTPSAEGVTRRGDGSGSSGFTPQTNVSLKTAIQDMTGLLAKVGTTQDSSMEKMPQDLQKIVQNIMRQAFSMEETLGQGIGSTLESQRFSTEQLMALSRMLTQLGALTEKGFSTEISDNLQVLLTNLKNYLMDSEGAQLSPVLLNKTAFELLDTKISPEDLSQTLQLLLSSMQNVGAVPAQPVGENDALGFLKQLVQYFMPRPQGEETSADGRQTYKGGFEAADGQQGGQEAKQSSQSSRDGQPAAQNQQAATTLRDGQSTNNAMRQPGQPSTGQNQAPTQNSAPAGQPTNANANANQAAPPQPQGQPTANQAFQSQTPGQATANQASPSQGGQAAQNAASPSGQATPPQTAQSPAPGGQPAAGQSAQPQPMQQAGQQAPTGATPQNNGLPQSQGQPTQSAPAANAAPTAMPQNTQTPPQAQTLPQTGNTQAGQTAAPTQSEGQAPTANNAPQSANNPQNSGRPPGQPISTMEVRQAKAQMMAQPLQNTPQTMETMKNAARFLLKNAAITPEDSHLLQNFVNGSETVLSDKEARQLQTLLRICQQNVPTTVQQAAIGQNMPDLPKLWAFMQLCDMVVAKKMSARQLKKAGKDVADFALSMRNSLGNENSGGVQRSGKGRSLSFLLPLFMGDNEKSYPSYVNVYDEEEMDWETMRPRKETWFRICVLTDHIGAVDITCRVYEGLQLDIRVFFSDREAARDFVEVMPEVRRSLRNTDMQLNDFSIGVAGMKERVAG